MTCIYLACKVEENHIQLKYFLDKVSEFASIKISNSVILKTELQLLQGLRFHLVVYHPFRSLDAFAHDFQNMFKEVDGKKFHSDAKKMLIMLNSNSDATFLYPPGTIALSAMYFVAQHSPFKDAFNK